jgi:hypothetical protein
MPETPEDGPQNFDVEETSEVECPHGEDPQGDALDEHIVQCLGGTDDPEGANEQNPGYEPITDEDRERGQSPPREVDPEAPTGIPSVDAVAHLTESGDVVIEVEAHPDDTDEKAAERYKEKVAAIKSPTEVSGDTMILHDDIDRPSNADNMMFDVPDEALALVAQISRVEATAHEARDWVKHYERLVESLASHPSREVQEAVKQARRDHQPPRGSLNRPMTSVWTKDSWPSEEAFLHDMAWVESRLRAMAQSAEVNQRMLEAIDEWKSTLKGSDGAEMAEAWERVVEAYVLEEQASKDEKRSIDLGTLSHLTPGS